MSSSSSRQFHAFIRTIVCLIAFTTAGYSQQANRPEPQDPRDDVIRINTELVQTEVMVFDRQGRLVEGLKPEQFELNFNGTRRSLSFFEEVVTGSAREVEQRSASQSDPRPTYERNQTVSPGPDRGRIIFFFLDDIHLSPASLVRARQALQAFVDEQMNSNDQVAIVSTSGKIGFLQQLTDNPAVLRAAISRLSHKTNSEVYTGKTQISEYLASQVLDYGNRELYAYLLESTKIEQQMGPGNRHGDHGLAASYSAAPYLRNRLHQIRSQGRMTTEDTLDVLESLIVSSYPLPGRKVLFFLSDGFTVNEHKLGEKLQRITRAASHSGIIIYTMDARGTVFNLGSSTDASTNDYIDPSARRVGLAFGEVAAMREPLKRIADGTGGRAIFNLNSIGDGILQAVQETSKYYLLAWRPDPTDERDKKSNLSVVIKDRPNLTVRWRSNYSAPSLEETAKTNRKQKTESSAPAESELRTAIASVHSQKVLPVSLALGYVSAGGRGQLLKISMQIERQFLNLDNEDPAAKAEVDVVGVAVDDRGQMSSFKQLLTVAAKPISEEQTVTWNQQLALKPGLYQVRIALRERSTGRLGSATRWIEIPDTAPENFALSSLFLGERKRNTRPANSEPSGAGTITVDVDHRFARSSILRFQTYVYNASAAAQGPDVWIQVEVLANRRRVMSIAGASVPKNANGSNLPYWSEISLDSLSPGHYVLRVSATDRIGDRTTVQESKFSVE